MALSDFSGPRLLSRPVKLRWAGWETDTFRLQQAGWELSADQDIMRQQCRLCFRHREAGWIGQTLMEDFRYAGMDRYPEVYDHPPEQFAQVRHMGRQVMVHMAEPPAFRAIDAMPQLTNRQVVDLEDLAHFATPLVRTKEIILPEPSVDDLLAQILERQQEAKTAYFREELYREGSVKPRERFHAQIISIAA